MPTINTNNANRSYTITGVTNDVTYKVRVAAVNEIGVGPFTEYVYATPSLFAVDNDYYHVELLMDMDSLSNADPYYGNTSFVLSSEALGVNDDQYPVETKLLLHGDGIAIVDSSLSNKTVNRSSNTVVTTSDSRFGTGSIRFTGNDYLTIGSSEDFSVGTGDFTVELFIKFTTINSNNPICNPTTDPNGADSGKWYWNYSSSNGLRFGRHATGDWATTSWSPSTGTWYHLAIVRASGIIKMYIDGVEQTVSNSNIFNNVSFNQNGFAVGRVASINGLDAQMDEFRFTKGVARTIVVPSSPYPNPKNLFKDISAKPKNIIVVGDPALSNYTNLPSAPADLEPSQPQSGSLTLSWDVYSTPPGIVSYAVEYSTDGGVVWNAVTNGVFTNNSVTVNNLADGFYIFRVAANNGVGQGPWSNIDISLPLQATNVQYLLVAGGASGGSQYGGGGGGGGFVTDTRLLFNGVEYLIAVGGGGAAPVYPGPSSNGSNSSIGEGGSNSLVTAVGGGRGGDGSNAGYAGYSFNGFSGGSGGGGGVPQGGSTPGGSGISGQGNPGGTGGRLHGGGGGGAGGAGQDGGSNWGGNGGPGLSFYGTMYAGGGGGMGWSGGGTGGAGGGGSSGTINAGVATPGQTNTGGGGGSSNGSSTASGGSGVVIIRAPRAAASTMGSPTVSTVGGDTVYTFTGTGSITF